MIDITLHLDDLGVLTAVDATGHADFDKSGQDIVCAAASAILGSVSRTLELEPMIDLYGSAESEGDLHLKVSCKDNSVTEWLRGVTASTVVGLKDLAESYPEYCRISLNNTNSNNMDYKEIDNGT